MKHSDGCEEAPSAFPALFGLTKQPSDMANKETSIDVGSPRHLSKGAESTVWSKIGAVYHCPDYWGRPNDEVRLLKHSTVHMYICMCMCTQPSVMVMDSAHASSSCSAAVLLCCCHCCSQAQYHNIYVFGIKLITVTFFVYCLTVTADVCCHFPSPHTAQGPA